MTMKTLLALALSLVCGVPAVSATKWPDGARAAVVLTYDDALDSQLDKAVPVLDAAGLKATFFLVGVKLADVPRWRAVAAKGHELANHTIFHPCPASSYPADSRYTSEAYTPGSMLKEIEQQNVLLTALDGKPTHGFASPCGQTMAGGVDYLEALRAAKLVTYVRGVYTAPDDLRADVGRMDPMHVPSRGFGEGTTGALSDGRRPARARTVSLIVAITALGEQWKQRIVPVEPFMLATVYGLLDLRRNSWTPCYLMITPRYLR
jgi:peptidoglycan/xylan/chitin deacetylase (PgdA/CDA1 family)